MTGQEFPKHRRMRRREDFLLASRQGRRRHSRHFMVVFLKTGNSSSRLGLTVSRKIGGAVQRNRVKRLVREFFRRHSAHFPEKTDISVVAKRGAAELDQQQVWKELRSVLGAGDADNSWSKSRSSR